MQEVVLILGGNKLGRGIYNKFHNQGKKVYIVDYRTNPGQTGDGHICVDAKDPDSIIEELEKRGEWKNVIFTYSSIDAAVSAVAVLNRKVGLMTISDDALKVATSKSAMTKRWNENGLLNRFSFVFDTFSEKILIQNKDYKLIFKPDDAASSRGITITEKDSSEIILKEAFDKAKSFSSDGFVVVEEFVEGTEFTVEMIGDSVGNVSVYGISKKYHTKNTDNNKIAIKLHYNSVDNSLQKKIADYAIKCYKSLGFSSSLGHLEIILKKDGTLSPVEIGARSSGFIASDLVDIVSGSDFLGDMIKVQNGMTVKTGLHPQTEYSSMYYFYDFPPEKPIQKTCNIIDYSYGKINSRYYDRDSIVMGRAFPKLTNDQDRFGYEVLEGLKNEMTIEKIEMYERQMINDMFGG